MGKMSVIEQQMLLWEKKKLTKIVTTLSISLKVYASKKIIIGFLG